MFVESYVRDMKPRKIVSIAVGAIALLIVFTGLIQLNEVLNRRLSPFGALVTAQIEPLHIVNTYGLFAVMTTNLPEIVVEGSDDGVNWREYEFKYKPGDVMRRPRWNAPHQPRLDWQMWFAALGTASDNPWFSQFIRRLLENSPAVTALLETNPFPRKPPLYVRALLYDYRYSTPEEKKATGAWWVRQPEGIYFPAAALKDRYTAAISAIAPFPRGKGVRG